MMGWHRKQMAGLKPWPLDSKALLTMASSHYPQHQFTVLSVDGIYKDYLLIPFCCLELDALLCKQLTHVDILCTMLGRKQVSRFYLFLISNLHDWILIPLIPAFANLPMPGLHSALSIATNSQVQGLLVIEISVPVSVTSKYSFVNEVHCLAIIAQSSKTSTPAVTHASTLFPLQRSMGWLPGKYNYMLAQE